MINGNNSQPFTLQSSTGRIEGRACRCERRRVLLLRGLLRLDFILWRKQAIKPGANLVFDWPWSWTPPPWTRMVERNIRGRKKERPGRSESWNNSNLMEDKVQLLNIWKLSCGCGLTSGGAESLQLHFHWLNIEVSVFGCVCVCLTQRGREVKPFHFHQGENSRGWGWCGGQKNKKIKKYSECLLGQI